MSNAVVQPVPKAGQLQIGSVYRRRELHTRFGGNRYSGIVPSSQERVVLLFHTKEPAHQYYEDGMDADGVYWYSGEGTIGDMSWTAANRSVRDHNVNGTDLLLFERAQRTDGLWRYKHHMYCVTHRLEERKGKE